MQTHKQGPAFYYEKYDDTTISKGEKGYALAGMIICFILFCGYLYYQWWLVNTGRDQLLEDTIEEIRRNKILNGEITLAGYVNTYMYTVYTYITYI
jgi:hypothetical protein